MDSIKIPAWDTDEARASRHKKEAEYQQKVKGERFNMRDPLPKAGTCQASKLWKTVRL